MPGVQGVGRLDDGTAVWFPTDAGMKPGDGSMAEYAVVPAADVAVLPEDVDHHLVAALGLSAVGGLARADLAAAVWPSASRCWCSARAAWSARRRSSSPSCTARAG